MNIWLWDSELCFHQSLELHASIMQIFPECWSTPACLRVSPDALRKGTLGIGGVLAQGKDRHLQGAAPRGP